MKEDFLHYVWQFQQFDKTGLTTVKGAGLQVFKTGWHNTDAGPDFSEAEIWIGELRWSGQVEIHVNSSDWVLHRHETDRAYDNVILHVVWEHNKPIYRTDGSEIPTLELRGKVDLVLIDRYQQLMESQASVPCQHQWEAVKPLVATNMIETALIHRLQRKGKEFLQIYQQTGKSWEEAAYRLLCRNFGLKINAQPMERLAASLPYKHVQHRSDQLFQLEALFFGQSGLLPEVSEEIYTQKLQKEHAFLSHKYRLEKSVEVSEWKFFRLRPPHFPTLRIAQLAAFLHRSPRFFSQLLEAEQAKDVFNLFEITVSDYWHTHYQFGKTSAKHSGKPGKAWVQTLLINTLPTIYFGYALEKGEAQFQEKALRLFEEVPAESNRITKQWDALGQAANTAFESQGLIELYNSFCQQKKCLQCGIGVHLLKRQNP